MDTNFNNDGFNAIYLENIENYIVINEEMYKAIMTSIEYNYLLIAIMMSCFAGILCSMKKRKNDFLLVQDAKPVKGEIIEKV